MARTVVILGAGWAGLPLAHKLLRYTAPKVADLKVVLVSPNTHFFWNVAATRGIIPGEIPDDELFIPIQPAFAQYPQDQFEFILGKASAINIDKSAVSIGRNDGSNAELVYDQLVIATGSRLKSDLPLKPMGAHQDTLSQWHELQGKVDKAKSIVIAGGGATGVELAGELAAKYLDKKRITIVMSDDGPVSGAMGSVRDMVQKDLQKLGITLVRNARVERVEEASPANISLSNGQTIEADLYLPAYGIELNTSFVPSHLLDKEGNVNLDSAMKVVNTANIWGIGDVGNIDPKQLTITDNQIIHLASALHAALTGSALPEYKPEKKTLIFISLGKKHATGQIGNWRLWGWMVNYVKGRRLFVDTAQGYVGGKHLRHAAM